MQLILLVKFSSSKVSRTGRVLGYFMPTLFNIIPRSVGEYVAILVLLIKRDVPQFVTVFVVIIFSLGGALYLSLVGHYSSDNIDTENNNDTRFVLLVLPTTH